MDVIALYNYTARTNKEVSFSKGDIIRVFSRTNVDWWDARVNGKFGFVPVPYVKVIERPSSVSDVVSTGHPTVTRRKSNDYPTCRSPGEPPSTAGENPHTSPTPADARSFAAFNPATQQLKSASTSSVGLSSTGEHQGNVFAALDPTVRPGSSASNSTPSISPSPASVRRSGSDRSGVSGGRVGSFSNRSQSQSERFGNNGSRTVKDADCDESHKLQSTVNKVSNAFGSSSSTSSLPSAASPANKLPILPPSLPPSAAKQYMAGQQNAEQNKIKEEEESESTSTSNVSRGSVKDRTKMFHNTPIMGHDRPPPPSLLSKPPSSKNTIHFGSDKSEHVPSFRPPPPPTALKPKGAKELAQAVVSAAAKKSQSEKEKDNVTHL